MKLYLVSLVLLMVPMALAELPISVAARFIYDHGYILSETKETVIYHENSGADFYLTFEGDGYLHINKVVTRDRENPHANLTFVAEVMLMPNGSKFPLFGDFDCVKETDESLRHLVSNGVMRSCFGKTRLRKLTQEETDRMNKFKSSPEAVGKQFKVIYDGSLANASLASQSVGFDRLTMTRLQQRLSVEAVENVYDENGFYVREKNSYISLFRFQNKSFAIEGTKEKVDCMNTEVENLWVVKCKGNIRARSLKDDDLPHSF